jgi:hypothetical protein
MAIDGYSRVIVDDQDLTTAILLGLRAKGVAR